MRRSVYHRSLLVVMSLVLLLGVACAGDPIAQVAKARSEYDVRLTNFLPQYPEPEPVVEEPGEAAGEDLDVENAAEADAEAEVAEVEMAPQPIAVLFDLVVSFKGAKSLPGVTVDVIQQDAEGNEKTRRQHYVETPNLRRGSVQQVAFALEGLTVAEGDSFGVSIVSASEAERAALREFAEAGQ